MVEKILSDRDFIKAMQGHCYEVISRLVELKVEFAIVANTRFCGYEPQLPDDLNPSKNPLVMFVLAGYTFESIELKRDKITFHAGFGPNDFATFVSVDLGAITQIQVQDSVIFVNFSFYQGLDEPKSTQNSANIFLKNPKNKDKLKSSFYQREDKRHLEQDNVFLKDPNNEDKFKK